MLAAMLVVLVEVLVAVLVAVLVVLVVVLVVLVVVLVVLVAVLVAVLAVLVVLVLVLVLVVLVVLVVVVVVVAVAVLTVTRVPQPLSGNVGPPHYFTFSIYFHGSFHQFPVSMEVSLLLWKLPWKSVAVHFMEPMEVGGSRFTSMEVIGSFRGSTWNFHCRWKWKLPLL